MNAITVGLALHQTLESLEGLTEIRDADGNLLGYFSPAARDTAAVYSQAAAQFDPEEMKRRKESSEKGQTTAEVLAQLKSLEN